MDSERTKPFWSLPYSSPIPTGSKAKSLGRITRWVYCFLLAAALIGPVAQFQIKTMTNLRRGDDPKPAGKKLKTHKGAIGRWRTAFHRFWEGENIYRPYLPEGFDPESSEKIPEKPEVWLHPNTPFVVILLSPFAYMPVWMMALSFNVLKLLVLIAAGLMAVAVANHKDNRLPDWVLALALIWSVPFIIDDIQHGNTNGFVLGAIVCHLWLYRRGGDLWAGVPLALGICLKMTPALFLLYWIYQRNWKLLGSTLVALLVFMVIVPVLALGPTQYCTHMVNWLDNLIIPGLVKGAWYPIHINQSVSGVFARYFLGGQPGGDIFWGPDDKPYILQQQHGWIGLMSLSPVTVKWMIRMVHVAIVAVIAWGIGWKKLPRDDGRRGLHYGLIALGMMLLNQRTWEHHATVLLVGNLSIWYAIGYARVSVRVRRVAFCLMLLGFALTWTDNEEIFKLVGRFTGNTKDAAEIWTDWIKAYGATFYYFVLLLVASVILSVALRTSESPYAAKRQKLFS